jgi:hypothetical protein
MKEDAVLKEKADYIKAHHLIIFRFHDNAPARAEATPRVYHLSGFARKNKGRFTPHRAKRLFHFLKTRTSSVKLC